jgi:hypothetical protein
LPPFHRDVLQGLLMALAKSAEEALVVGTDRLYRPVCKHFRYWRLTGGDSVRLILLDPKQSFI